MNYNFCFFKLNLDKKKCTSKNCLQPLRYTSKKTPELFYPHRRIQSHDTFRHKNGIISGVRFSTRTCTAPGYAVWTIRLLLCQIFVDTGCCFSSFAHRYLLLPQQNSSSGFCQNSPPLRALILKIILTLPDIR